jgi:hypothetical protein
MTKNIAQKAVVILSGLVIFYVIGFVIITPCRLLLRLFGWKFAFPGLMEGIFVGFAVCWILVTKHASLDNRPYDFEVIDTGNGGMLEFKTPPRPPQYGGEGGLRVFYTNCYGGEFYKAEGAVDGKNTKFYVQYLPAIHLENDNNHLCVQTKDGNEFHEKTEVAERQKTYSYWTYGIMAMGALAFLAGLCRQTNEDSG